ncbi:hypothetical protein COX84_06640 [Candidatus Micrarchaeota archaeon CG_4_10_14_0_2_um_filter_49_7]|nr:MAG: hypothetical protein AUJ13_00705 [Candidatus Micrarchaeota archaeon CG1_02_49_24]PIZ92545.1 MAG: hypothetical protein COX84_06640 [Candidatus Micrarchaeota archaeon CG_4_10_14_0_2_um_filter_49_7]HII53918.1 hypothetical protein [Candidatus Micrarchaeota archaeon]
MPDELIFEAEYKGWKAEKKESLDAKNEKEASAILFEINQICVEKSFELCEPDIDLKKIESIASASNSASRKDLLAACKSKEFYHLAESYYLHCICRKK